MSEETIKILKMLEGGRISSQEADSLLSALNKGKHCRDHHHLRDDMTDLHDTIGQINPGKIVAEAMAGVRESLKDLKGFHIDVDGIHGSEKAGEEKEIIVPAAGITAISISQLRSDFEIIGADTDRITVKADIQVWAEDQDEAKEKLKSLDISTENEGGVLRIKVDGPPWTKKRRAKVDFTIGMPKHLAAEISSASGEISVWNLTGGCRLNTASGEIEISGCQGENNLSSVSGDITASGCTEASLKINTAGGDIGINDCSGGLSFQTVSGDVSISLSGDLQGQTVSGDIDIRTEKIGQLKVSSTSGDIQFQGPLEEGSQAAINTVSGDVSLILDKGSSAVIEAGTVSGDIECEPDLSGLRQGNRSLSGKLGDGKGSLDIKTVSGDITIS
ncbi:DUF4097 family beta strand repeat protein [candidate division TA06 bacterium]|uniref:DUF4097 family beta strand repeat protein n=1 Tax=candidate division TA06 bacterium TaxID=2250710 RepID=A0A933I8H0_UNCT6|nr:DUF4097 family beta strand repeat protein [candidate division TA06 bacterium]